MTFVLCILALSLAFLALRTRPRIPHDAAVDRAIHDAVALSQPPNGFPGDAHELVSRAVDIASQLLGPLGRAMLRLRLFSWNLRSWLSLRIQAQRAWFASDLAVPAPIRCRSRPCPVRSPIDDPSFDGLSPETPRYLVELMSSLVPHVARIVDQLTDTEKTRYLELVDEMTAMLLSRLDGQLATLLRLGLELEPGALERARDKIPRSVAILETLTEAGAETEVETGPVSCSATPGNGACAASL